MQAALKDTLSKDTISEHNAAVDRVKDYLKKRLKDAPVLKEIGKISGYSEFHFHRIFSRLEGVTIKDYITRLQINEAKRLLLLGEKAHDVARLCGFTHQSHLCSRFKKVVGQTPVRWVRSQRIDQK